MGSTSITISDTAYDYLKSMKRDGESFSDVILSLKKRKEALLVFHGIAKNHDFDDLRDELNESADKRMKETWS